MREEPTLSPREFELALKVLEREQEAHMPSRRQEALFRWFNFAVYTLLGLAAAIGVAAVAEFETIALWLWGAQGIIVVTLTVLFFLNLGLIRKLWNQARLRRRLRLDQHFEAAFRAERSESRLKNYLTFILSILGYPSVIAGFFIIASAFVLLFLDFGLFYSVLALSIGIAFATVGLSLVSFHFMLRGKQRLDLVRRLQENLSKRYDANEQEVDDSFAVDPDYYNEIARIERTQIITDRQISIEKGLEEESTTDYVIQQSREVIAAKAELDQQTNSLVDDQILQLTRNPLPVGSTRDPDSRIAHLPVREASVEITYQVNEKERRIRVLSLRAISGSGEHSCDLLSGD